MPRSSSPPSLRPTRRTEGVRREGRSARVVEDVLEATLEELGRAGFAALRVEDVATRSGVNKTTIYRRWPTKGELVLGALQHFTEEPLVPDTGELEADLLALLAQFVERVSTPQGRGLIRTIQAEKGHEEFAALVRSLRRRGNEARRVIFERAVARGELPVGSDAALLTELVMAPMIARVVHLGMPADRPFLEGLVRVIVAGARTGAAVR